MSPAPKPRVLLVDDNGAQLENLREILEDSGFVVATAQSCAEARKLALADGFDVALVDLRLPDGEGTALAAELRGICGGEVVLLTGFATVETAAAAVRAGAFAYLLKPCATDQLLLTLEQAMRQVRLHAEKAELSRRAQLAERLAAVGTLTAGLSHEIRNPLNAAALQLTVLERRLKKLPPEQQQGLLEPVGLVQDEIKRLDRTLTEFLSFAKPKEYVAERLELAPVVARVLDLLEGAAQKRQVRVDREISPGAVVLGSADQLQQVLVNLVLNAVDAAGSGGWVRVRVAVEGREAVLEVDDSGSGVPVELRGRIFEPFFTTKANGSGLGLPMVHNVVVQHGGAISVDDAPTGGARFLVRLPLAA
ncbi:MAG: response regulator [Deltaproteobacteria bacterium]|nr:response regulator [Deltaproteobacteria bacterium]